MTDPNTLTQMSTSEKPRDVSGVELLMNNHQGIKAAINTDDVRGELALLQSEFQRSTDIAKYGNYIASSANTPSQDTGVSMMDRSREVEAKVNARMAQFTHLALTGILNLLEA